MIQRNSILDFLKLDLPIIDVRAPIEFNESHIPGAINIPLLNDEHRALVGTAYKTKGKEAAMSLGYQLVLPIQEQIIEKITKLSLGKTIKVYCARGGLRSQLMSEFFEKLDYDVIVLEGGYKKFRDHVFQTIDKFNVLGMVSGYTGTGKTEVLEALGTLGEQVLNLEALANHRGSAFGALGQNIQMSTANFHNLIYNQVKDFNHNEILWLENESIHIGKVHIPINLWEKMKLAVGVEIVLPIEERVKHILKLYGNFEPKLLMNSVNQLSKRLGMEEISKLNLLLLNGELDKVVHRLLKYYDNAYEKGRLKRNCQVFVKINFETLEADKIAEFLLLNIKWKISSNGLNLQ